MKNRLNLGMAAMAVAFAVCVLAGVSRVVAADDEHQDKAKPRSEVKVPDNATNILATLEKHLTELKASVAAKKAGDIHKHANALKKLAGTLPPHATPATKKDVDATARDLAKAADAAHESAHDDNWTEVSKHVTHAETALKKLKEQFKERNH